MGRLNRRLLAYVGSLLALTGLYSVVYRWGMAAFEGERRTWYGSLEIVIQSMTTTGYGQDAPWESLEMTALMVLVQVTGIAYIFVAFPLFVVPWLERLVEPAPPETTDEIDDHVLVFGYTDLCRSLVDELVSAEVPYLIVEADRDRAETLHEAGLEVLHADPTTDEGLETARLEHCRAVVVDATGGGAVSPVLAVTESPHGPPVFALATALSQARYLRYAGVDEVLLVTQRLGKALGDKVRDVIDPDLGDDLDVGTDLHIVEYPIDPDSDLFGAPLETVLDLEATGATVLGAWVRGDFVTALADGTHVDENTTLLVAGSDDALETVADAVGSAGHDYSFDSGPVIVVGAGEAGRTALGSLERAGRETVVVNESDGEVVDVAGDPTEEETLRDAGIDDAATVLVALEDDDRAILATLVARALAPESEILVGIHGTSPLRQLRTAGANYVLSLPNIAGRMVTTAVFEEEVMTLEDSLQLVRAEGTAVADEPIRRASIRERTGCLVVAIERDGDLVTGVDGVTADADDHLIVAGTEPDLAEFLETDSSERGGADDEAAGPVG